MGLFKGVSVKGNESGTIDANLNMTYRIHGTYMRSEDNSGS
jgi:hypothetical protein